MGRVILVVVAALALAGCSEQPPEITAQEQVPADQRTEAATEGAGEGGGGGAGGATFVAIDIDFAEAPETLPAGETEITLVNEGAAMHDVTLEEIGDVTVVSAQGGETVEGSVELEPGTHTYYCSVPGHRQAGMEGELTVE